MSVSEEGVFQVTLGDFSGPLDLLCHLVESRAMDASSLKLTEVLSQYVRYLLASKRATLSELADFFSLASRLLLRKVRALMPKTDEPGEESADDLADADEADVLDDAEMDEATLQALLERFRPYRTAAALFAERKTERERHFVRISDEGGPPWFDIGDLHGLSTLWWSLIEDYSRHRSSGTEAGFMMEIPDAVPEEVLVEQRMGEVLAELAACRGTTLGGLLKRFDSGGLIVTLLALLELSRLGRLDLTQSESWGEVEIAIV